MNNKWIELTWRESSTQTWKSPKYGGGPHVSLHLLSERKPVHPKRTCIGRGRTYKWRTFRTYKDPGPKARTFYQKHALLTLTFCKTYTSVNLFCLFACSLWVYASVNQMSCTRWQMIASHHETCFDLETQSHLGRRWNCIKVKLHPNHLKTSGSTWGTLILSYIL